MRWFLRVSMVGVFVCAVSVVVPEAAQAAKGGRGGGGRGGISSRPSFSQRGPSSFSRTTRPSFSTQSRGFSSRSSNFSSRRPDFTRTSPTEGRGDLRGREWALERQRTVAERNLEKRRSQAEHLRSISERNGNEQLLDTADRMEQRGQEQYQRRIDKINSAYSDLDIPPPPDGGTDGTVTSQPFSPTTSQPFSPTTSSVRTTTRTTTTNKSKWTGWWPFGRSGR